MKEEKLKKTVWTPPLLVQTNLWGEVEYIPITRKVQTSTQKCVYEHFESTYNQRFGNYLNKRFLPVDVQVEGDMEMPCVYPFTMDLPQDIVGIDERIPSDCGALAVHGFCYDHGNFI